MVNIEDLGFRDFTYCYEMLDCEECPYGEDWSPVSWVRTVRCKVDEELEKLRGLI